MVSVPVCDCLHVSRSNVDAEEPDQRVDGEALAVHDEVRALLFAVECVEVPARLVQRCILVVRLQDVIANIPHARNKEAAMSNVVGALCPGRAR